jgi:hypothetical protein
MRLPLKYFISIKGGKETKADSFSSGKRKEKSPARTLATVIVFFMPCTFSVEFHKL